MVELILVHVNTSIRLIDLTIDRPKTPDSPGITSLLQLYRLKCILIKFKP